MKHFRTWGVFAVTAVAVVLLVALLPEGSIRRIATAWNFAGIAGAFVLYCFSYLVISARWRYFFGVEFARRTTFADLFSVASLHNLWNQLFPARTGEVAIVVLAKEYLGVGAYVGASSLVLARAMDFLAIGLCGIALLALPGGPAGEHPELIAIVLALCALPVVLVASFLVGGEQLSQVLRPPDETGLFHRARALLSRTAWLLSRRRPVRFYAVTFGLSLLLAATRVVMFAWLLWMAGSLSFFESCIVGLCTLLISSGPFGGVMSTGTFEAGWVLGSVLAGLDAESALVSAVAAHLVFIVFQLLLGGGGQVYLSFFRRQHALEDDVALRRE